MDKEIEITGVEVELIKEVGDVAAKFFTEGARGLSPAAVAAMNQKFAAGEGYLRLTTEVSSTGMRVFTAFVTKQSVIPILDIYIGNSDEDLDTSEGTSRKVH